MGNLKVDKENIEEVDLNVKTNKLKDKPIDEKVNILPVATDSNIDCCIDYSKKVHYKKCEDELEIVLSGDDNKGVEIKCQGRLLKIKVKLKGICKGRKLALGVLLLECINGEFKTKGFKATNIYIPDDCNKPKCSNLTVGDFLFVLPEENICCKRTLIAKVIVHYTDLEC
ncbi:MAG: hypothetical protein FH751_15645 [Firmicutes bacterium]|nr:hypothetical protein [Bacillota bacterium]